MFVVDVVGGLSLYTGCTNRCTDGGTDRSGGICRHQEARSSGDNGYHGQFEVRRAYWTCRSGPGYQQGGSKYRSASGKPIIVDCLSVTTTVY